MVLTREQHQLLLRLSKSDHGQSAASYVRGLLDFATPHLTRLVNTIEALEAQEFDNDRQLQEALARELEDADNDLGDQLSLLDPLEAPGAPGGRERPEERPDRLAAQVTRVDAANDGSRRVSK